jgi:hypothetical protein
MGNRLVISEELKEVLLRLTPDQARFQLKRVGCETDKEAAEKAGVSYHSIKTWRKHNPDFNLATRLIFAKPIEAALMRLERLGVEAVEVLATLLYSDKEHIQLNAANSILKLMGIGSTRHVEISGSVGVRPDVSDDDLMQRAHAIMERKGLIVEGEVING